MKTTIGAFMVILCWLGAFLYVRWRNKADAEERRYQFLHQFKTE